MLAVTAAGRSRSALIAACTALVSGLLLVAVSISRLGGDAAGPGSRGSGSSHLMSTLADPGTRGGTVFGVVLLTLPVVALFNQGVRLGTAARRRRYEALSVAGATRRELRGWAAIEVGAPAAVGSVLGIGVWWILRELFGRGLADRPIGAIVPPDNGPGLWTILVVAGVAAIGILVGARSVRPSRTPPRRPALPLWGVAWLVLGVFLFLRGARASSSGTSDALVLLALLAILAGVISLAPWLTRLTATAVGARTRSSATLLAARRLSLDPRPAARAALATGAGGLVFGVLGGLMADLGGMNTAAGDDHYQAVKLVAILTTIGFLFIGLALAIHITDTVLSERRAYAALSAVGFSTRHLLTSLRWEALMATLPVAVLGCALGTAGYAVPVAGGGHWIPWSALALLATILGVITATFACTALVGPVVRNATATGALRTE